MKSDDSVQLIRIHNNTASNDIVPPFLLLQKTFKHNKITVYDPLVEKIDELAKK